MGDVAPKTGALGTTNSLVKVDMAAWQRDSSIGRQALPKLRHTFANGLDPSRGYPTEDDLAAGSWPGADMLKEGRTTHTHGRTPASTQEENVCGFFALLFPMNPPTSSIF